MAHGGAELEQRGCDLLGLERRLCSEPMLTFAVGGTFESNISAVEAGYGARASHVKRTQKLAARVAIELCLQPDEIRVVWYAAVLHDLGKLRIPDSILDKPGKLNESEWEIVRRHPERGAKMLAGIAGFERIRAAVAAHHERFDGCGYPAGLVGLDIPIEARLISVADAYDAMTSYRPYRTTLGHLQAMEQLGAGVGSQFDPAVVEATKAVLHDNGGSHVAKEQESELSSPPSLSPPTQRGKEAEPRNPRIRA